MKYNKRDFIPLIFDYKYNMKNFYISLDIDPFEIMPIGLIDYRKYFGLKYEPKTTLTVLDTHELHIYFHMMGKIRNGRSNQVISSVNVLWDFIDPPIYEDKSLSGYVMSERNRRMKEYDETFRWFPTPNSTT
jgi:hypothetical protein